MASGYYELSSLTYNRISRPSIEMILLIHNYMFSLSEEAIRKPKCGHDRGLVWRGRGERLNGGARREAASAAQC